MPGGRARREVARSAGSKRRTILSTACGALIVAAQVAYADRAWAVDQSGAAPPPPPTGAVATPNAAPTSAPNEAAPPSPTTTAPPASNGSATTPEGAGGATASPTTAGSHVTLGDELKAAGYIPGYRAIPSLGLSTYSPRVAALPGGMTPAYGAPNPANEWTFRWTGFFTASLQASQNVRNDPAPGQSKLVFHVTPQTVDEYGSFVGTSTVPGEWTQLNFVYGNRYVSANLTLTSWNPSDASTFYQIGSQQFINNFYLQYSPPPLWPGVKVHALLGYFYNQYGSIGQYGLGMYTNAIVGGVRGVGEDLVGEYAVNDDITLTVEDGLMGNRNGMGAINIVPTGQNGESPIVWPSSWIHHFHVGFEDRGDITIRAHLHYMVNWSQDDRVQMAMDDPQTRQIDESYVRDGKLETYGADVSFGSPILGYLGAAVSYTKGENSYPLQGLVTFGGDGQSLTNRWWGQETQGQSGNGSLVVAGVNYSASIGRLVSFPVPFNGDGPDLALNVGFVIADSWSDFGPFDARLRYKGGADLLYTFCPYVGVGLRADAVFPNSHDAGENFYVLAPRLVFKSNWNSRDTVTLLYGRWFYGSDTHPEASSITTLAPGNRLDDSMFAINAQIWW